MIEMKINEETDYNLPAGNNVHGGHIGTDNGKRND